MAAISRQIKIKIACTSRTILSHSNPSVMSLVRLRAMATVATRVASPTTSAPNVKPILAANLQNVVKSDFTPGKHLLVKHPVETIKMVDLGYSPDVGISPVAVSQPFQLFSEEAIEQMRAEILKPEVMENCQYKSNIAACQLRGYSPK
jgi:hypothetical protein